MIVIPAIDLRQGRAVRLLQGDFERETCYPKSPLTLAGEYAATGFRDLHVVDLDGALAGQPQNEEAVREIVDGTDLNIQLGGGIRTTSRIDHWLETGVMRVVIGSAAVTDADIVNDAIARHGPEKIVLALDVRFDNAGVPRVASHGWTRTSEYSLWQIIDRFVSQGLQHVLCTDISRDGAMSGPNLALYRRLGEEYPELKIQASGGVRDSGDLVALQQIGSWGAISGRAFLDGRIARGEISSFLPAA